MHSMCVYKLSMMCWRERYCGTWFSGGRYVNVLKSCVGLNSCSVIWYGDASGGLGGCCVHCTCVCHDPVTCVHVYRYFSYCTNLGLPCALLLHIPLPPLHSLSGSPSTLMLPAPVILFIFSCLHLPSEYQKWR